MKKVQTLKKFFKIPDLKKVSCRPDKLDIRVQIDWSQGKNTAVCCFFGPGQQADVDKVGTISFLSKLCRINQSCTKNRKTVLYTRVHNVWSGSKSVVTFALINILTHPY